MAPVSLEADKTNTLSVNDLTISSRFGQFREASLWRHQAVHIGVCSMSTRMLMVLAFLTGMAIIVAFAVQLVLYLT